MAKVEIEQGAAEAEAEELWGTHAITTSKVSTLRNWYMGALRLAMQIETDVTYVLKIGRFKNETSSRK